MSNPSATDQARNKDTKMVAAVFTGSSTGFMARLRGLLDEINCGSLIGQPAITRAKSSSGAGSSRYFRLKWAVAAALALAISPPVLPLFGSSGFTFISTDSEVPSGRFDVT